MARKAIVYLRQASISQVKHNTESQRLQYAPLTKRRTRRELQAATRNSVREYLQRKVTTSQTCPREPRAGSALNAMETAIYSTNQGTTERAIHRTGKRQF